MEWEAKDVLNIFGLNDDQSKTIINNMLTDYDHTSALAHADIVVKNNKFEIEYMTGSHEEFFIDDFFKLVLKLGGTPLKSVSIGDGMVKYIYTYSKKAGIQLKIKGEM